MIQIAVKNGIDYATCLGLVRDARKRGLTTPLLLMGMSRRKSRDNGSSERSNQAIITLYLHTGRRGPFKMPARQAQTGLSLSICRPKKRLLSEKSAPSQSQNQINIIPCIKSLTWFSSISYVPLIAPATTSQRIKFLASIADSFLYVVSKVSAILVLDW